MAKKRKRIDRSDQEERIRAARELIDRKWAELREQRAREAGEQPAKS